MTIEITKPEIEAMIHQRRETGAFKDAEEMVLHALRSSPEPTLKAPAPQNIDEVFANVRGLLTDEEVDTMFRRDPYFTRTIKFE